MPHKGVKASLFARSVVELLGSMILVFTTAGSTAAVGVTPADNVIVGIASGLGLMVAVWMAAPISGGHINPLVSLLYFLLDLTRYGRGYGTKEQRNEFYTRDRMWELVVYVVAQLAGGLLAAVLLLSVFGGGTTLGTPFITFTKFHAFAFEIIGTSLLLLVSALLTNVRARHVMFVAVPRGMTLIFLTLFGRLISGAVFNWAGHLGPAVVSNTWNVSTDWLYYAGPAIAVVIIWIIYAVVFMRASDSMSQFTVAPMEETTMRNRVSNRVKQRHRGYNRNLFE